MAAGVVVVGTEAHLGPRVGKGYEGEAACVQQGAAASLEQAVDAVEDVLDVGEAKQQEHLSEERCSSCTRPLRRRMSPSAVAMKQALGVLPGQSLSTTALDRNFVASRVDRQVLMAMAQEPALAVALLRQVFGVADVVVPSFHRLLGLDPEGTAVRHLAQVVAAELAFAILPFQG